MSQSTKTSPFRDALKGINQSVPVWFMRQAGRYLPEYQAVRKQHSLEEMFGTPEIAAEVTCQPIDILGVDAAILFADILTLPTAMGFDIRFDNTKGPQVRPLQNIDDIRDFDDIPHIQKTIKLVNQRLPEHIPLIGFAGSPYTVATYLIEGGSSVNFFKTFEMMHHHPREFHRLMEILTKNTIRYIKLQEEAGIKAFQLFDTWAGVLRPSDYAHFVLPYVQEIFQHVSVPSIYYLKNTHHLLALMNQCEADFLSVDHTVVLGHHKTTKGIQGNLFNGLLYASDEVLKREVRDVLEGAKKHDKFIFNLSHGIFPNVNPEKLKLIVDQVHAFPWNHE
ncbi:MAG: uroporphyrinogen decarboxylase [Candidatus Omnitrophica bacterium]|nr:uroporphyrinogen decarboxylase [Candidatus Omnitrophota bacterium]